MSTPQPREYTAIDKQAFEVHRSARPLVYLLTPRETEKREVPQNATYAKYAFPQSHSTTTENKHSELLPGDERRDGGDPQRLAQALGPQIRDHNLEHEDVEQDACDNAEYPQASLAGLGLAQVVRVLLGKILLDAKRSALCEV